MPDNEAGMNNYIHGKICALIGRRRQGRREKTGCADDSALLLADIELAVDGCGLIARTTTDKHNKCGVSIFLSLVRPVMNVPISACLSDTQ